jgi:hypothetical protein
VWAGDVVAVHTHVDMEKNNSKMIFNTKVIPKS